jgi:protein phosphatase
VNALKIVYGGKSDVGYGREVNEDCIKAKDLGGGMVFLAVADGMGSLPGIFQPAAIAVNEVLQMLTRLVSDPNDKALLAANPGFFLKEGIHLANRVLGAFKLGNEEKYAGYGACITCALFYDGDKYSFAHAGNTRLWLLRAGADKLMTVMPLTTDHTKAAKAYAEGLLDEDGYHTHPDNVVVTSGVGIVSDPEIQVYEDAKLKNGDIILMTTDGLHYSLRPDAMVSVILDAGTCDAAAESLVTAGIMTKGMIDNMSAVVVYAEERESSR